MGNKISNVDETRTITAGFINNADKKRSNTIKTSKYTLITFLPKNLFGQFKRFANFYFLFVNIVAILIDSPVNPNTTVTAFVVVILVTMIKQGYEDWLRHRMDNAVNNERVSLIENSVIKQKKSRDIKPGQFVKIYRDSDVPCDAVLLWSCDSRGKCFVTTANLDGETSLKPLKVPTPLINTTLEECSKSEIKIEFSQPESNIYTFFGRINVNDSPVSPLSTENLLLRGSRLKNTEWVIGCAIYTGKETKLALNSHFTSNKFTSCERSINNFLIFFILLMVVEIIVSFFIKRHLEKIQSAHEIYWGESESDNSFASISQDVFSFLLLYYYCIPISLYVSIEIQKFLGSQFFEWDVDLYSNETDQPALVNTSDLNEELGQIEILFTDKTGTLTKNDMYFQMCSINGKRYIEKNEKLYEFNDSMFNEGSENQIAILEPDVQLFFTILALCHSVQIEEISEPKTNDFIKSEFDQTDEILNPKINNNVEKEISHENELSETKNNDFANIESTKTNGKPKSEISSLVEFDFGKTEVQLEKTFTYQSISSDEVAFVKAATNRGIIFFGDDANKLFIKRDGMMEEYEKLNTLEFTSLRKMMSVIVKDENGQIWLFCKGAESAVLPLCLDIPVLSVTDKDVQYFAEKGLRTLVVAYKKLTEEEYVIINEKLMDMNMNLQGRLNPESMMDEWRSVEQGLTLLGATAVEDRLQDDVIGTMKALRCAGIKIWVLTGDKVETAINVAQSCGHIPDKSEKLFLVNILTQESLDEQLSNCSSIIKKSLNLNFTLILDGQSLALILDTPKESMFVDLCLKCEAVICCRLSPMQKALIVRLIKKCPSKPITAAVGDGANDISMIQEAHVGFGIFGKEGRQAARSSDFAFSEFQMLKKVLLVHGHWYYQRLATLVQYSFYKNLIFSTLMLFLQINSNFSTQSIFDSTVFALYNLVFVSVPIVVIALSEHCHSPSVLLRNPALYKNHSKNKLLSWKYFFGWCSLSLYHCLVIYGSCFAIWYINPVISTDGKSAEFWCLSQTITHLLVVIANLKLFINTRFQSVIFIILDILTILVFMSFTITYTSFYLMYDGDVFGTYLRLLKSPTFWLLNIIVVVMCFLPDFIYIIMKNTYKEKKSKVQDNKIEATSL